MVFEIGSKVELVGLKNQSFNGKYGIIKCKIAKTGRYGVSILGHGVQWEREENGEEKALKEENLRLVHGPGGSDPMSFLHRAGQINKNDITASAWQNGLGEKEKAEWLVDCYRMRLDDEYVYMGCLRSVYEPNNREQDVINEFLQFCVMAVRNKVVRLSSSFPWKLCLEKARELLSFAFEKSDAQEKYGSEHYFSALIGGGRSLRFTGEIVYGIGLQNNVSTLSIMSEEDRDELKEQISGLQWKGHEPLFDEVGGFKIWQNFASSFKLERPY
jgi:hypothetical protein